MAMRSATSLSAAGSAAAPALLSRNGSALQAAGLRARAAVGMAVIVSVDWEPDHGRGAEGGAGYAGIREATPVFEKMLDSMEVPCTWFVESSAEKDRDLPALFPDLVGRIAARNRDEVGLHVHWRRGGGPGGGIAYETRDRGWVRDQLGRGAERLAAAGARPVSFRSGALLYVDGLPGILEGLSFQADSSTLWNGAARLAADRAAAVRRSRVRRAAALAGKLFSGPPDPYHPDPEDVEARGCSRVVEFPIWTELVTGSRASWALSHRGALASVVRGDPPRFVTLFFHIDELLERPARAAPGVSAAAVSLLRGRLAALRAQPGTVFLTMREAASRFART